ncbi:MAG TPA: efflux RND transporter periplasmic adaptor subunit [Burkholderiales bacterium]
MLLGLAGPASGHEGEVHGDEGKVHAPIAAAGPRFEAATPDVEVVAVLQEDNLVVYLDRYASNEPITNAAVEIESGENRAVARPLAPGTYAAPAAWLARPGKHPVVVTIQADDVSDLVTGTLEIQSASPPPAQRTAGGFAWIAGPALVGIALLAGVVALARRRGGPAAMLALPLAAALLLAEAPGLARAHGDEDHGEQKAAPVKPGSLPTSPTPAPTSQESPARLPDGSVHVPKPAQRLLGLRTRLVELREIPQTAELKGHVVPDPNSSGRVQASQPGRVEPGPGGFPYLGQKVKKGEVLAYLSPVSNAIERGNQTAQLAEVSSALAIAEQKLARYAQLEGSVPRKEVEAARTELESLKARRDAVSASLYRRESLAAPASGVVSASTVSAGQVVETREVLFEIVDPQRLWVEAVAYDMSLKGQITGATGVGAAGQPVKLTYLGAGWQLREQALPVQFRINPPLPPISVGEKVMLFVETRNKVRGVALPRAAVTRASSGEALAWVHVSAERFAPRRVQTVALDGVNVAVTGGLQPGERVVTEGAALLAQVR